MCVVGLVPTRLMRRDGTATAARPGGVVVWYLGFRFDPGRTGPPGSEDPRLVWGKVPMGRR